MRRDNREQNQIVWNLNTVFKLISFLMLVGTLSFFEKNSRIKKEIKSNIDEFNNIANSISANCMLPNIISSDKSEHCINVEKMIQICHDTNVDCNNEQYDFNEIACQMLDITRPHIKEECHYTETMTSFLLAKQTPREPAYCQQYRNLWSKPKREIDNFLKKHPLEQIVQKCSDPRAKQ